MTSVVMVEWENAETGMDKLADIIGDTDDKSLHFFSGSHTTEIIRGLVSVSRRTHLYFLNGVHDEDVLQILLGAIHPVVEWLWSRKWQCDVTKFFYIKKYLVDNQIIIIFLKIHSTRQSLTFIKFIGSVIR